jgi:hypothetical protein
MSIRTTSAAFEHTRRYVSRILMIVFKLTRPQNLVAVSRMSSPGHRIVMAAREEYTLEDLQRREP